MVFNLVVVLCFMDYTHANYFYIRLSFFSRLFYWYFSQFGFPENHAEELNVYAFRNIILIQHGITRHYNIRGESRNCTSKMPTPAS